MKELIVTTGIAILFVMFLVFQADNNRYVSHYENLKYITDDLSNIGALYYNEEQYAEGKIVFQYDVSNEAILTLAKERMKLGDNFIPLELSYWSEKIVITTYYFDDSKNCKVYKNGTLSDSYSFDYSFLYQDMETNYHHYISNPTVIVTINAGRGRYNLKIDNIPSVIRSSSYEWKTY